MFDVRIGTGLATVNDTARMFGNILQWLGFTFDRNGSL
jgi:hypothetical protein